VQGTFLGHPESGLFPGAGICELVTYRGGDGNDVVLQGADDDYLFVRGVYHGLALPLDSAKIANYVRQLRSGQATRRDVATAIWNSREHRRVEVALFYQALGEPTTDGNFDRFVRALQGGTPEGTVLTQLLTSKRYLARHRNRTANVRLLLRTLTGKEPTKKEVRRALAGLARGAGLFVPQLLSSAPVYKEALAEHFVSFLGRAPTAADTGFFTAKLATGTLTPLDLLLDVVTGSPASGTPSDYAREFLAFLRAHCTSI
jgi:hypothetical protein